jgi:putative redox protein
MAQATLTWVREGIFIGTDSTQHSVVLSKTGEGGGVGMKPSELLLVSLASCTAVDIVNILEKKRLPLKKLEVAITGEQDADPPWQFRKIHLTYRILADGITEKALEQAIELSDKNYCSVAASLRGTVQIEHDYEVLSSVDVRA